MTAEDYERIDWWSKERILDEGILTANEKIAYNIIYDQLNKALDEQKTKNR